jgi:hypothetical protein
MIMADTDDVPEELAGISPARLKRWGELGLAQVKADLEMTGGRRVVGGPPEVRQQAWRWVNYLERQVQALREAATKGNASNVVPPEALERIWGEKGFRVFLSHRAEVKEHVGALKDELEIFGARCFVAHRDISATQDWQDEILSALASMDCLVAVITAGFHASDWTDQEIGHAIARGVPVVALKVGAENPRGFISRFQARTCDWSTAGMETLKIIMNYAGMFDAYVSTLRKCPSWSHGNVLGKVLPGIKKLTPAQIDTLVAAFNETSELTGSFAFNGCKASEYGPGLASYLNRLGTRQFEFTKSHWRIEITAGAS